MNDRKRQDLEGVYSTWADAALLTALTTARGEYRAEVLPMIEAEAKKRNLPVPPPPCTCASPTPPPRVRAVTAFFRSLGWKHMSWVGRGYLSIFVWTFLPMVPPLVAGTVAAICGSRLDEGSVHPCFVFGCDIGGPLYAMGVMGWFMLLTFPTGVIGAVAFTIVVLVWKWRTRRRREEECQQRRP